MKVFELGPKLQRQASASDSHAVCTALAVPSDGVRATVFERRELGPKAQRQASAPRQRCNNPSDSSEVCMAEAMPSDGVRATVPERRYSGVGVRARLKIAKASERTAPALWHSERHTSALKQRACGVVCGVWYVLF